MNVKEYRTDFLAPLNHRLYAVDSKYLILENIPRSPLQAQAIRDWADNKGVGVEVVVLSLTEDEVVNRASKREVCPDCGKSYHPDLKPSQMDGTCDDHVVGLVKKPGDDELKLRRQYIEHTEILEGIKEVLGDHPLTNMVSHDVSGRVVDRRLVVELFGNHFSDDGE